jgi:deoxyribodipyrimidine photo-lyase
LYHPDDIPFGQDEIPKVFTPFRKKVEKTTSVRTVIEQARPRVAVEAKEYQDGPIPSLRELGRAEIQIDARAALAFKGGETAALDRLSHYFFERRLLERYKETRNGLVGADYSSKFSPWLALGCLSPRYVYQQVKAYEAQYVANDSTYWLVFELLWRDFFRFVFWRHENALFQHKGLQQLGDPRPPRAINEEALERWRMGNTGIPFVDANMFELLHTGFMSNRGRQNVASYLVHVLGCDWRWGAEWFESQLVDYDPCSNWGNWAYIAGAGNDPRSRYFNVLKQANDYDPKGAFVRHWIPKLSAFGKDIHTPFRLSEQQWQLAGLLPDIDYPKTDLDPEKVYQKLSRHR